MRIVFFLPNAGCKDVDCHNIENGNPGIGGTEYLIIATACTIQKAIQKDKSYEIIVAAQNEEPVKSLFPTFHADTILDCIKCNPDYIVFKYQAFEYKIVSSMLGNTKTKLIPWAHNFIPRKEQSILDKDDRVASVVCVSEEQLNMMRDHHLFLKSIFIYNGMPVEYLKNKKGLLPPLISRPNEVTYIGSIVDYKGVHLLAKIWKKVLTDVSDAKLNIIGGGNLYSRNTKLGKYGIAEESYENVFMPYLTDEDGKILPSVKFWGVLGEEKNDILARTRVGVPNPSGVSETFCITALEMQAMGALVTTIDFGGFRNTVYKTGLLYQDPKDLAKCIIIQLQQTDNDIDGFYSWMEENFAFEKVVEDWMRLFESLKEKRQIKPLEYNNPNADSLMQMREYNRKIKSVLGYWLPTIDFYRSILRRIGLVKGF